MPGDPNCKYNLTSIEHEPYSRRQTRRDQQLQISSEPTNRHSHFPLAIEQLLHLCPVVIFNGVIGRGTLEHRVPPCGARFVCGTIPFRRLTPPAVVRRGLLLRAGPRQQYVRIVHCRRRRGASSGGGADLAPFARQLFAVTMPLSGPGDGCYLSAADNAPGKSESWKVFQKHLTLPVRKTCFILRTFSITQLNKK